MVNLRPPSASGEARASPPADIGDRARAAQLALADCHLCSRRCGVDRLRSAEGAYCRLDRRAWLYKELLSHGEEACVGPTWLLDLGGCSLRCLFCTEWAWVTEPSASPGVPLDPRWFAARLAERQAARSLTFVGGEPTVSLPAVLASLAHVAEVNPDIWLPVVWNTNGLITERSLALLDGVVTTWSVDLKLLDADAGRRWLGAGALDTAATISAVVDRLHPSVAPRRTDGALAMPPLIVRHLMMPGRLETDTLPWLERCAARWPNAVVNLMTMYLPFGPALRDLPRARPLKATVSADDKARAIDVAKRLIPQLLVDGQPA